MSGSSIWPQRVPMRTSIFGSACPQPAGPNSFRQMTTRPHRRMLRTTVRSSGQPNGSLQRSAVTHPAAVRSPWPHTIPLCHSRRWPLSPRKGRRPTTCVSVCLREPSPSPTSRRPAWRSRRREPTCASAASYASVGSVGSVARSGARACAAPHIAASIALMCTRSNPAAGQRRDQGAILQTRARPSAGAASRPRPSAGGTSVGQRAWSTRKAARARAQCRALTAAGGRARARRRSSAPSPDRRILGGALARSPPACVECQSSVRRPAWNRVRRAGEPALRRGEAAHRHEPPRRRGVAAARRARALVRRHRVRGRPCPIPPIPADAGADRRAARAVGDIC